MSGGGGDAASSAFVSLVAQFGVAEGFGVGVGTGVRAAPPGGGRPATPTALADRAGCGFGFAVGGAEGSGDVVTGGGVGGGGVGMCVTRSVRTWRMLTTVVSSFDNVNGQRTPVAMMR